MKRSLSALLVVAASLFPTSLFAAEPDSLATRADRRNDALVGAGYNLTQSWSLGARDEKSTVRLELLIPPPEQKHAFSFWAEGKQGVLAYRLLGIDGNMIAMWSGQMGESVVELETSPGKYVVEIDRGPGVAARAVFGVKGPALQKCAPRSGSIEEQSARPDKGYRWPYLLLLPKVVRATRLLVVPNNSGFSTVDLELLRTSGSCEIVRQSALAERLGTPLLVPLFPRPPGEQEDDNLYLHALTRASLDVEAEAYRRVDLQLLAMIDDARSVLHERRIKLDSKVFLWGFSASGSFVNRFAMLHPERVAAVACGSPGGWPIAPVSEVEGETLGYPVGVADLKKLVGHPVDIAALKRIDWFFFLGDQDENDAVPYRDSFSKADEELIFRRFGTTPVSRWKAAEQLYQQRGLSAQFRLYPGVAHSLSAEIDQDIAAFFERARR